MDTYLPADFRELHAAAVEDWRDASSANWMPRAQPTPAEPSTEEYAVNRADACADPLWRVL